MIQAIEVKVNGTTRALSPGTSLAQIIEDLLENKSITGCAVAVNGEVVRRADWPVTTLSSGDAIEVVHATQGG